VKPITDEIESILKMLEPYNKPDPLLGMLRGGCMSLIQLPGIVINAMSIGLTGMAEVIGVTSTVPGVFVDALMPISSVVSKLRAIISPKFKIITLRPLKPRQ